MDTLEHLKTENSYDFIEKNLLINGNNFEFDNPNKDYDTLDDDNYSLTTDTSAVATNAFSVNTTTTHIFEPFMLDIAAFEQAQEKANITDYNDNFEEFYILNDFEDDEIESITTSTTKKEIDFIKHQEKTKKRKYDNINIEENNITELLVSNTRAKRRRNLTISKKKILRKLKKQYNNFPEREAAQAIDEICALSDSKPEEWDLERIKKIWNDKRYWSNK
ncbi:8848_t:CDS:2 [Gigaspora margarita]|uniref:8848_t:CDS:1 n=1 Tax=Gigaspora margarita TaxID=4874 RepID=A0ABM8W5V2_GIGMA|nr:8848_t:CDS:2 [Gigaspora margarita]